MLCPAGDQWQLEIGLQQASWLHIQQLSDWGTTALNWAVQYDLEINFCVYKQRQTPDM